MSSQSFPVQVCTNKMNLSDEVDLEDYIGRTDKISAAEISSICQEAGMQVRNQAKDCTCPSAVNLCDLQRS